MKYTIDYDDYKDETNDPRELGRARLLGPLDPRGTGKRIPHTGFVDAGDTFILVGPWPAKMRKQKDLIPTRVNGEVLSLFGKGSYHWNEERKEALALALANGTKWDDIVLRINKLRDEGVARIAAFDQAVAEATERKENGSTTGFF